MINQKGSSLVVALVMLTIITLVAVYSIEGSTIQSKMVASSLFSSLTYQECRNEQEASVRFYNANGGTNRSQLLGIIGKKTPEGEALTIELGGDSGNTPITKSYAANYSKSEISTEWSYIKEEPAARGGYNLDSDSQSKAYLFQNNCQAQFRFSNNNQTLGAVVEGLQQAGNIN